MVSADCRARHYVICAAKLGHVLWCVLSALFSLISHHDYRKWQKYLQGIWLAKSSVMTFGPLSLIGRIGVSQRLCNGHIPGICLVDLTMPESHMGGLAFFGLGPVICGNVIMVRARTRSRWLTDRRGKCGCQSDMVAPAVKACRTAYTMRGLVLVNWLSSTDRW